MKEQELLLNELESKMMPDTSIEFVHFCLTDIDCTDLVDAKKYSRKYVIVVYLALLIVYKIPIF